MVSTPTFETLATVSINGGLVAGAPEFDLSALNQAALPQVAQSATLSFLQSDALFPKAHAYDVDLMDIMSIAGSLIGLDSVQVIWEQMGNMIAGQELDVVAFSVAILDVLSLFPPAAPLKAVAIPAKLVIPALRAGNSRSVQYLGGVLKKMFEKVKVGDPSLVYQGIAFIVILADMYQDEEARAGIAEIAKMINSTDDFLDLLDYFSLADDEITLPVSTHQNDAFDLFPQAYASVATGTGTLIGKAFKELAPLFARHGAGAPKALATFAREIKEMEVLQARRYIRTAFNKDMIRGVLTLVRRGGLQDLQKLLTQFPGQRIRPLVLLATIAYLEEELVAGRLFREVPDRAQQILNLQRVILQSAPAFKSNSAANENSAVIAQAHGKSFQLLQIAVLHAQDKHVLGVEVERDVYIYSNESDIGRRRIQEATKFGRNVDVLVKGSGDQEIWYEVKSWKSKDGTDQLGGGITPWKWASGAREKPDNNEFATFKLAGTAAHKQLTLDQIAVNLGAKTRRAVTEDPFIEVEAFHWLFHQFKVARTSHTTPAINPSLTNIRKGFNKPPALDKFLFEHAGMSPEMAVTKIDLGFLQQFLDNVETGLKEAITEEMRALGNE